MAALQRKAYRGLFRIWCSYCYSSSLDILLPEAKEKEAIYTIEMRRFILVLKTHFWFTFPILSHYLLFFRSLYLVLSHVLKTVLEAACAPLLPSFFNWFYFQTSWSAQRGVAEPITKGIGRGKVRSLSSLPWSPLPLHSACPTPVCSLSLFLWELASKRSLHQTHL